MVNLYLKEGKAKVVELDDNCEWFDTGTHDSMLEASQKIKEFQESNEMIGSIELSLYKAGMIDRNEFKNLISIYTNDYQEKLIKSIEIK